MSQPLNRALYQRLVLRFGDVTIANEGETAAGVRTVRSITTGRTQTTAAKWGEYYRVNCPFCNDTRKRLYVNYLYGQRVDGEWANWLCCCYNENCLHRHEHAQTLREQLLEPLTGQQRRLLQQGAVQYNTEPAEHTQRLVPVSLPGTVVPLTKLAADHPAIQYLQERKFDARTLTRDFEVGFCVAADPAYPMAAQRIVAPIRFEGELVGWQCRYPGELAKGSGLAKYYTRPNMPKRLLLYNYDQAREQRILVVTEGVTDTWRVGKSGVAVLGKTLTVRQRQLLADWAEQHDQHCLLVIAFDGEVADDNEQLADELRTSLPCAILPLVMPETADPADYTTQDLWALIRLQARAHDIPYRNYCPVSHVSRRGTRP